MTRRSLVVGGSKGIGRTLARRWSRSGHDVTVLARTPPLDLNGVAHVEIDLEDGGSRARAVEEVSRAGPFDDLVFVQRYRGEEPWSGELAITLDGTKDLTEALVDRQPGDHPASIVFVTSLAASLVVPDQSAGYHAAKAGLDALMRYYAVAYAPRGIRVNGLAPGQVLKEEAEEYFRANPEVMTDRTQTTPLGRMGTAAEMAELVDFLCSERAAFVTGHVLVADGGLSLPFQGALRSRS